MKTSFPSLLVVFAAILLPLAGFAQVNSGSDGHDGDVLSVCMMLLHHRAELPMRERLRLANGIVSQFIGGKRQLIPALAD